MNMKNLNKTDIGLIGLAVMGEKLALRWQIRDAMFRYIIVRFRSGRRGGGTFCERPRQRKKIEGYTDIAEFVTSIAIPRKIMMMVRAGSAVDELMEQLFPHLSEGDILILRW